MKKYYILAILLVESVSAIFGWFEKKPDFETGFIVFTDDNFDEKLKEYEKVMIEFYNPDW